MTLRNHLYFWSFFTLATLCVIWILRDVVLPFATGALVAYLLGPVVGRMIRAGVPRNLAALVLLLSFFAIISGLLALIIPFAYREAVQLAADLPKYADQAQLHLTPYIALLQERFPVADFSGFEETLKNNIGRFLRMGSTVLVGVASGGKAVAGMAAFVVIVPIVAFFVMAEWVRITTWIDDMIPRRSYATIRDMLTQMDRKISGFIRGQLVISCVLGLTYALVLTLAGLKFGFLIGLAAGVLSVVPMVGSAIGMVIAVLVAWFQHGELGFVGIVAAIFLVGQFLEGNIITPRVLGDSVGLHPLWILFSLLAGGALYGIVGMILAVPVAAVVGVLLSFAIATYKASPYYGTANVPDIPRPSAKKGKKNKK